MNRIWLPSLVATLVVCWLIDSASAQPRPGFPRPPGQGERGNNDKDDKPEAKPLPNDKRLVELHLQFVKDAEKLAEEYEKKKEWSKAKDVYGEIVKLVPQYENARIKLNMLLQQESTAMKKLVDVAADQAWQDTGIIVEEGKPVTIRAAGTWTFVMKFELTPDGITIPKELRDFNLGCLVAAIDTGNPKDYEPFSVGVQESFIAKKTGRLMLRMYDVDPADNVGKLKVEIQGSFQDRKP